MIIKGRGYEVTGESVEYTSPCPDCAAALTCSGGQELVGSTLEWSIEYHCPTCGWALADCGRGDLPDSLRGRLLAEHGPARLQLADPAAGAVTVMKVLRAELGGDLAHAKATLHRIRTGTYVGTLAEMALLAMRLQDAGIAPLITRPRVRQP
ncbi:hypothetical protein [Kitasatospora sp. NBC_01302]|uniref:hypothetical protein n=1 Tax=Kitasatospora sp. NBC_01302 TaxID=2903575 RepID=UPI002E14329F|nr:hypothetical protein OG294_39155 [Kitasatospora sp. NBC_01302]